jgi:hypothetical protein
MVCYGAEGSSCMRNIKLLFAIVGIGLAGTNPAEACRGPHSHRYIFLQEPPAKAPDHSLVLKVKVDEISEAVHMQPWLGLEVDVVARVNDLDVDGSHLPKKLLIQPSEFITTSCDHWGIVGSEAIVVGYLDWNPEGKLVLVPIRYRAKEYRTLEEDGIKLQQKNGKPIK